MDTNQVGMRTLAIISIALFISSLWMVSGYLNFYKTTMKTEVLVDILDADIGSSSQSVLLGFTIVNQISAPFEIKVMNYELKLNGKHLNRDSIKEAFEVSNVDITFERRVEIPEEWSHNLESAIEEGKWSWSVSGSLHLTTYMGETRIRFTSIVDYNPIES